MEKYFDLYNDELDYIAGYRYSDKGYAVMEAYRKCRRHHVVEVTIGKSHNKIVRNVSEPEAHEAYVEARAKVDNYMNEQFLLLNKFLEDSKIEALADSRYMPCRIDVGVNSFKLKDEDWNKIEGYLKKTYGKTMDWKFEGKVYMIASRINLGKAVFE